MVWLMECIRWLVWMKFFECLVKNRFFGCSRVIMCFSRWVWVGLLKQIIMLWQKIVLSFLVIDQFVFSRLIWWNFISCCSFFIICVLLVLGLVLWRKKCFFSGVGICFRCFSGQMFWWVQLSILVLMFEVMIFIGGLKLFSVFIRVMVIEQGFLLVFVVVDQMCSG